MKSIDKTGKGVVFIMKEFSFKDSEGVNIACYKWENSIEKARGVVQIIHGMTEHARRYDYFAKKLVEEGFIVYAHDHRGHGNTASEDSRGYIGEKDGFDLKVKDVKEYFDIIKKENPDLPIIIFGHSMGSFVSQRFIQSYGDEIDGVILSGTNGKPMSLTKVGIAISKIEVMLRGRKAKSKLMDKLSFGNFNSQFKENRTDFDWLCSVDEEVDKYINDEQCGFICSTSFYYDLLRGLWTIHKKENLDSIPKHLPVYILAGDKDPVGNNGKGIISLHNDYKKLGLTEVSYRLYSNGRHEILNEINKDEVIGDIINWILVKIKMKEVL